MLLDLPQETLLHIRAYFTLFSVKVLTVRFQVSFLDLPDLAALARVNQYFAFLAEDPVLHRTRLRVIAPSRVDHSLFGKSPRGVLLRPTVPELVHRGVMRGYQFERRWRAGDYLYSSHVMLFHIRLHASLTRTE